MLDLLKKARTVAKPDPVWKQIVDRYYEEGTELRELLLKHSRQVADEALEIAHRKGLRLDDEDIVNAAMVHDIGIFMTNAPGIHCHGPEPYLRHGVIGAALMREAGDNEALARVAERHTGAGITAEEISRGDLPLPVRDLVPETLLERLICYADKFYSKSGDMQRKSLERVRASMAKHFPEAAERFERLHEEFR